VFEPADKVQAALEEKLAAFEASSQGEPAKEALSESGKP